MPNPRPRIRPWIGPQSNGTPERTSYPAPRQKGKLITLATKRHCDRCDFVIGEEARFFRVDITAVRGSTIPVIDLCPDCYESMITWFREKPSVTAPACSPLDRVSRDSFSELKRMVGCTEGETHALLKRLFPSYMGIVESPPDSSTSPTNDTATSA